MTGDEVELRQRIAELERRLEEVERLLDTPPPPPPPPSSFDASAGAAEREVSAEVRRLVQKGKKIEAIKVFREETGCSLRDAKDVVDRLAL